MNRLVCCGISMLIVGGQLHAVTESKTESYAFDVRGELEIKNGAGSISIQGSDQNKLTVAWTKNGKTKEDLAALEPVIEIRDKETEAYVKVRMLQPVENASIDFNITVPRYAEVKVEAGSGNVIIRSIKSQMKLVSGAGSVAITDARKEIEVRTGSGNVDVSYGADGFGKTDIKTGSGNVSVANSGSSVDIKTGSGLVEVKQRVLPAKEDIDIKTSTGNIILSLPRDVNATVQAGTKTGNIGNGANWERKKKKVNIPTGDEAKLVLGKGFADIKLATTTGSIAVQ